MSSIKPRECLTAVDLHNAVDKEKARGLDPRFLDTEFLVEADSFSKFALWKEHHGDIEWVCDNEGVAFVVGFLTSFNRKDPSKEETLPVYTTFNWAKLNGHRVCFYYSYSRVTDWLMVERWVESICYPLYDDTRHAHCDAMNFHHCLQFCKRDK